MKTKEKTTITINLNKNIKEKLDKYEKYGYNKSEIVTMGIILLQDTKNFEKLLNKTLIEENTIQEMKELKKSINKLNKKIDKQKYKTRQTKLDKIIQIIYEEELLPREQIIAHEKTQIKPIGKELFKNISEETGIPTEEIIQKTIDTYTEEYLKQLNININKE